MAPSYQLVMRAGPTPGKVIALSGSEMQIGRDVNNDIAISDSEVSRKHARLTLQAGEYVLEDLGSTNGTFVNGQRLLGPHVLRPGEMIMLGENVSLLYESAYDADATMVASAGAKPAYTPPAPRETQIPPPVQMPAPPPPTPAYSGQIPAGPAEPYYEAQPESDRRRPLIIAGCGCLLVLACVVVGFWAFDALNLYCTGPFRSLEPLYQLLLGGVCTP